MTSETEDIDRTYMVTPTVTGSPGKKRIKKKGEEQEGALEIRISYIQIS